MSPAEWVDIQFVGQRTWVCKSKNSWKSVVVRVAVGDFIQPIICKNNQGDTSVSALSTCVNKCNAPNWRINRFPDHCLCLS